MSESATVATVERLVYTRKEAAAMIGVGTSTLDALLRREVNPVPSVRIGHKVMIPRDRLREWLSCNANQ